MTKEEIETSTDQPPPCGIIFEFKELAQAKAFVAEIKEVFGLDSRVFDDDAAAANSHFYPFARHAPVVHVDRPIWYLDQGASRKAWDEARAVERRIEDIAVRLGGEFVGT